MSAIDDLRAAGFGDDEINAFATQKRATLAAGGFSDDEINGYLGAPAKQPDVAQGNKTFARALWDRLSAAVVEGADKPGGGRTLARMLSGGADAAAKVGETVAPVETSQIEAALNAGTGLLFGFPAQVAGALGGLTAKHALGLDVDPAAIAEGMTKAVTYTPRTKLGVQLTGQVNVPFELMGEGASWSGHKMTDLLMKAGASDNTAALGGALTEQTVGLLPMILLGELGRKMGGQRVDAADMQNVAKVIAGDDATPQAVAATEASLHATYEKTGIGPFTVAEEAARSPEIRAELADPAVDVPTPLREFIQRPAEPAAPRPGDGAPLLDVSEPGGRVEPTFEDTTPEVRQVDTPHELPVAAERADDLRAMGRAAFWAQEGGKMLRGPLEDGNGVVGPVIGRTPWLPAEEWFGDMRRSLGKSGLSKQADIQAAIEKAIAGETLTPREARTVDYIRAEAEDMRNRVGRYAPEAPELANAMMEEGLAPRDVELVAKMRRAAIADPAAYDDALGAQFDRMTSPEGVTWTSNHDDPVFAADIDAILAREVEGRGNGARSGEEPGAPASAAQPSSEGFDRRPGAGTLNAGINPAAVLSSVRDAYTPFVGVVQDHTRPPLVDSKGNAKSPLADNWLKVFSPASRGEAAKMQAGIMRANLGEMARQREVALERLKEYAAGFDKLPVAENIKFIDAMERGTEIADPKLKEAAKQLRTLLDAKRDEVQALGKGQLENFDENYFPHIWKDADEGSAMFARRPLTGSGSFLKARTIPLTTDGLKWRAYDADGDFLKSFDTEAAATAWAGPDGRVGKPLTPITTNPVELALLKAREMDKYVYGQRIFEEMKTAALARFVGFGDRAPPGWTKIDDRIARVLQKSEGEGGGMILRGEYYAPDEAATLINNHLSPGLQGNTFFDAWRKIGSMMNSAQLGLSLFHVGFTTMDSMISKVALGLKQISRGDVLSGAGNVVQGFNPAQSIVNIYKGDRLMQAYLGKLDSPELSPIVDAIQQAGGRVKMDDFYRNTTVNEFKQALRSNDALGAAKSLLPTILDRISAPIFEELVPRQKLGVFFDMAKDWLEKNPDAKAMERREGLGKLWDSVDNRMGQLVYDNVFWNHALKDGLMATVRSVGWNLGTFRELGGGVLDLKNIAKDKALSDRTAYVLALPMVAAVYGAVTNYAFTGEMPRDLKDCFYPRTGRDRPDGSEDRVSLPTYMKDVFAYGEDVHNFAKYGADPTQTLKNKAHPLIATVSEMLTNKDFFDGAIRNPADTAVQQIIDEASFLRQQTEPFSIRNYQQQAKMRGEEPTALGYLTSPSMIGIAPAPGYITKTPEQQETAQVNRMREPIIQKYRQAIKNGMDRQEAIDGMIKGGLSRRDIKFVIQSSGDNPRQARPRQFRGED